MPPDGHARSLSEREDRLLPHVDAPTAAGALTLAEVVQTL